MKKTLTFDVMELLALREALSSHIERLEDRAQLFRDSETHESTIRYAEEDLTQMRELRNRIAVALELV
jgi:hypothetical protein